MDKVIIRDLQFFGYVGVTVAEQEVGHRFNSDITLYLNISEAVKSDDIGKTVDYGVVAATAVEMGKTHKLNLVETLASRIAETILADHPMVQKIEVKLEKMLPCIDISIGRVGVEVVRER